MKLRVKVLTSTGRAPSPPKEGDVGYDLHADWSGWIGMGEVVAVPLGVAGTVPSGTYGRIAPRSGLAVKHGIDVLAGVVDPSYVGEWKAVLINHGAAPFRVNYGDRVAQLVLERCETPDVEVVEALPPTARGSGGFGSSGTHAITVTRDGPPDDGEPF